MAGPQSSQPPLPDEKCAALCFGFDAASAYEPQKLMNVAILWTSDGKIRPQFPFQISINTVVAILAATLKSALILIVAEGLSHLKWAWFRRLRPLKDLADYDMASRGPLGSFRLLFALRGRDFIATVGAFLTIAALAIDPFAQAIVQHYSCSMVDPTVQAQIPRTNMYFESGPQIATNGNDVPQGIAAAVYAGIYANASGNVPFDCPSGTCSFDQTYHTIGFCHACTDITSQLVYTTDNQGRDGPYSYNFTLPSGVYSPTKSTVDQTFRTYFAMGTRAGTGVVVDMILSLDNDEQRAGMPSIAQCSQSGNGLFGCNNTGAASCSLYPCVRSYRGAVKGGNLTETLLSTWSDFGKGVNTLNAVNVDCLSPQDIKNVTDAGITIEPGQDWLPYNTSLDASGVGWTSGPSSKASGNGTVPGIISESCIYEIAQVSLDSFEYWSPSVFTGNMIEYSDAPTGSSSIVDSFYNSITNNASVATLDSIFNHIADSLTGHIRQRGVGAGISPHASQPAFGTVINGETCVSVRWGWLAFPASMVAFTVLFFIAMVVQTRHEQQQGHDWKSSSLALIYHGLDASMLDQHMHQEINHVSAMTQSAKELHVRLTKTDQGWKLTIVI